MVENFYWRIRRKKRLQLYFTTTINSSAIVREKISGVAQALEISVLAFSVDLNGKVHANKGFIFVVVNEGVGKFLRAEKFLSP